jgi:hypothetical protein
MPDTTPSSPEESGPHDHHGEDWLQTSEAASAAPPAPSPYAPPPGYPAKRSWAWLRGGVWRSRPVYAVVGLIVGAGVVLGGVALADDQGHAGRAATGNSDNRTGNGRNDGGFNGRNDRGRGNEPDNGSGQAAGSEQRIEGTVSAVSATSITVRTANGSLTYALTANTPVTGAVSSVADLRGGEAVVVYVTSSTNNVGATIDRVIAG